MQVTYEKGQITIRVPFKVDGDYEPSKSGKSLMVATTSGFVMVPGTDAKVSLNVILPKK